MKSLRHPIRAIHEPFGKAGLIVAIVALVAALGGSAIAAKGALTGKQKKEVQKIAKAEAKKFAGRSGAAGPPGAPGAPGAKGDTGAAGANGTNGSNGSDGASVTSKTLPPGNANCVAGGTELKAANGTTYACNGEEGPEGPEGPPGPVTAELQPGMTETGAWAFGAITAEQEEGFYPLDVPISFPLALPADQTGLPVVFVSHEEVELGTQPSECSGSAEQPTAEEGFLCVYQTSGERATFTTARNSNIAGLEAVEGAGRNGTVLYFTGLEAYGFGFGTWALTAEK